MFHMFQKCFLIKKKTYPNKPILTFIQNEKKKYISYMYIYLARKHRLYMKAKKYNQSESKQEIHKH